MVMSGMTPKTKIVETSSTSPALLFIAFPVIEKACPLGIVGNPL